MKQQERSSSALDHIEQRHSEFDIRTLKNLQEDFILQRQDQFHIIWITKGKGSYNIAHQNGLVVPNHLLFIRPGQLYKLQLTEELDGFVVSFRSSFLDAGTNDDPETYRNFYQVFARTQTIVGGTEIEDMQDIISVILKEFTRHHLFRSEILKRYVKIFLIYLSRQFENPEQLPRQSRNGMIVDQFMAIVEKNYRTKKMVADYANILAVTPNYLNEVIKKTTGYPAGHHIRQRVALEAKRKAVFSNICMKSIAYDLGFCDMAHFSKFFKNTTGMNFSEFKNMDRVLQPVL